MTSRARKYIPGQRIDTIADFVAELDAGHFIIVKHNERDPGKTTHPAWAGSWQLNMALRAIRLGVIYRALPNPEHPENMESTQ